MNDIPCADCASTTPGRRFKLMNLVEAKDRILCSTCVEGKMLDGVTYDMVLVDNNE